MSGSTCSIAALRRKTSSDNALVVRRGASVASPAVKTILRCVCLAAFVSAGATAFASSAAPGVEVVVKAGRASVFQGLTDASGRFVTAPLEPGIYTFEVRIPKNVVTPARYFLALSGAKPMGEALMKPGVPLLMQAQVRRLTSVRGQVTARRVIIVPATGTTTTSTTGANAGSATSTATTTAARTTTRPVSQEAAAPAPTSEGVASRPVGYQARMINGRRHYWVPIAPGSTLGRWMPDRVHGSRATTTTAAPAQPSTPRPSPRRR